MWTIASLLVRFTVIYVAMLAGIAAALGLLGIRGNSGTGTAALLGAVMWVCLAFANRNKRYFSKEEKSRVILGMLGIDIVIQAVLVFVAIGGQGTSLSPGAFLFSLAFVAVLHAVVIYLFVGIAGRQYAKQNDMVRR